MVWLYIQPGQAILRLFYLFFCVALIEIIRSKIATDKRSGNSAKKVGRRITNFGFAIFVVTSIYQMVIDLNPMNPIGGLHLPFIYYGFLCLMACRSIELIRDSAQTSVDNARKTPELEEARQLQRSMLPKAPPSLPNLEIAWEMKTANEVGGDYYDFSLAADGTLTVAIGDVTGHGLNAGIVVATAKGLFKTSAHAFSHSPTLETISQGIKAMNLRKLYMAMTLATFKDNRLTITAAGMPPALIYRSGEETVTEVFLEGMPLGSLIGVGYQHKTFELQRGDTVLLMSDGLPERLNPDDDMLDYPKTKALFEAVGNNTPAEIIAHLFKAGEAWANGRPQDDDVTFVVMKVR